MERTEWEQRGATQTICHYVSRKFSVSERSASWVYNKLKMKQKLLILLYCILFEMAIFFLHKCFWWCFSNTDINLGIVSSQLLATCSKGTHSQNATCINNSVTCINYSNTAKGCKGTIIQLRDEAKTCSH